MRETIDFFLNGERVSCADEHATQTVLTWLRERRHLVGTKEGCAEGDCGACTAVIAELDGAGRLRYLPVNTCILCLGALDGRELITVEALKNHPVQKSMVERHGSQCGFCTPGFVMALYAHYESNAGASRDALCDAIAGNLCRCTGYGPIVEAGAQAMARRGSEQSDEATRIARLHSLPQSAFRAGDFFAPTTVDELANFLVAHPQATILAGGTDVGLWITKEHRDLAEVTYIGRVRELKSVRETVNNIEVGAAATYADAYTALRSLHEDIGELIRRLGAAQVRAMGTVAGNIANGSPIGDSMPILLALGCTLKLQKGSAVREVALENFYTGYRKNVLQPGEFIRSVNVPRLAVSARFAVYKVSKRIDQDISAVCGAFCVDSRGTRFAFGGMAPTPARAPKAETGYALSVDAACVGLAEDFSPITDQRASAWYRLTVAQSLLRKFHAGVSPRTLVDVAA